MLRKARSDVRFEPAQTLTRRDLARPAQSRSERFYARPVRIHLSGPFALESWNNGRIAAQ